MQYIRQVCQAVALLLGLTWGQVLADPSPDKVDFPSLLEEMSDLARLAEMPSPFFQTHQNSSWDRASKTPSDAAGWFANKDWAHYLRTETQGDRKENVLLDAQGPGAVVRLWSANPKGTLRIYIDGSETPTLEGPMRDVMGGDGPYRIPKPIAGVQSEGYNLFLPLPFAKSCKITSDGESFYYIVNYRAYAPGTAVESFKASDLETHVIPLSAVARKLVFDAGVYPEGLHNEAYAFHLDAGERRSLHRITGPRAIHRLSVALGPRPSDAALRGTVIRIRFDGVTTVEAPLGDFFGTGPGLNSYVSLPIAVTSDVGAYCHWVMPFKSSAEIELENLSGDPINGTLQTGTRAYTWNERSLYFNAGYRAQYEIPTLPKIDWNYLTVTGKGRLVGTSLTVDNPLRAWWGEGDEKIYVDGETFPSWFGTGTEDYFGYAWCSPDRFTHAYHNQPRCDGPMNYGRTSVNRFHVMDSIPFMKFLRFDMELWHSRYCRINQAVTMYWYASGDATDGFAPLARADLEIRPISEYTVPKIAGAIEAETMKVTYHDAKVSPRTWFGASDDTHIWWHGKPKAGDRLELVLPVEKAGKYRLLSKFILAPNNGIVRFLVNGKPVGGDMDLYQPEFSLGAEMEIGVCDLQTGENKLTVEMMGANPKADPQFMFCMDYIRPWPVDPPRERIRSVGR